MRDDERTNVAMDGAWSAHGGTWGRSGGRPRYPAKAEAALRALVRMRDGDDDAHVWVNSLGLPPRLAQVAACLALGDSAHQIGQQLGLSPHTARSYVKNLYQRLHVSSRVEAARVVLAALPREVRPEPPDSRKGATQDGAPLGLPPRLERVVAGVALGLSDKETAARLGLSVHTVRTYLKEVYFRLGLRDRTEIAMLVAGLQD